METWTDIKGIESVYQISNIANVRNKKTGRILKQTINKRGYAHIGLFISKKKLHKQVHRLVAESFLPNPDNKKTVNHRNGIKNDNNVCNLEWMTNSENSRHYYKSETRKISPEELEAIYQMTKKKTLKVIAKDLGIHMPVLHHLLKYCHPKY